MKRPRIVKIYPSQHSDWITEGNTSYPASNFTLVVWILWIPIYTHSFFMKWDDAYKIFGNRIDGT